MLRVYVSSSSREIERAEQVIATLVSMGIVVTHDWPARMRAHGLNDAALTRSMLLAELRCDLQGVRSASVFLFLEPETPTAGAWAELGYPAGLGTVEIVTSGPTAPSPWPHAFMAIKAFESDAAAIDYLVASNIRAAAGAA